MLLARKTTRSFTLFQHHVRRLQGVDRVPPKPSLQPLFLRSTSNRPTLVSLQHPLSPSPFSSLIPLQCRSFSSGADNGNNKKTKKKQSKQRKISSKKKRRRQSEKQKRYNRYQEETRKRNLHPAAKMKRILSATDESFSNGFLLDDDLRAFGGYVRLTTLANLDQLRVWTDDKIMIQTFQSLEAQKRYELVYSREVVEEGLRNQQRAKERAKIEKKEAKREQKAEKKKAKREQQARQKELAAFIEKTRDEFFDPIWLEIKQEWAEEEERERQQEANSATIKSATLFPKIENEEDLEFSEEIKWGEYFEGGHEESLMDENEQFSNAIDELEYLEYQEDLESYNLYWDQRMERVFGSFRDRRESKADQAQRQMYSHIRIEKDDSLQDEELSLPVVDDGSDSVVYALVRHKRKKLDCIVQEQNKVDDDLEDYGQRSLMGNGFVRHGFYTTFAECDDKGYVYEDVDDEEGTSTVANLKRPSLPKYKSERVVQVIKKPGQLLSFCQTLQKSLESSKHSVIGFDVEYCSLEMDIRGTLPAMLQLASPTVDGPVGLIWLDKFPNHGKDVVLQQHEQHAYANLLSILKDPNVLKVGNAVSNDARHLANWWGIEEQNLVEYYFSGMINLEDECLVREQGGIKLSLQGMSATILQTDLPKLKEKKSKRKKKKKKKKRTSHWRRDDLTKEMKKYAANDASSSIDIWLKLQAQEQEQ